MALASRIQFAICSLGLIFLVGGTDDVDVHALESLAQEQASTITNLDAKLTALQNEVTTLNDLNADVAELKNKVATLSKAGIKNPRSIPKVCPSYYNETSGMNNTHFPSSSMASANFLITAVSPSVFSVQSYYGSSVDCKFITGQFDQLYRNPLHVRSILSLRSPPPVPFAWLTMPFSLDALNA